MEQRQADQAQEMGSGQAPSQDERPVDIGRYELGEDGRLRIRSQCEPVRFRFHFQGLPFEVEIDSGKRHRVRLTADLGLLPYTAESPLGRRYSQRVIHLAARLPNGRLFLDDKDHICLDATAAIPDSTGPAGVFSAIAALLTQFLPYLSFLAEVLPGRSQQASRC